jgi:hypothetical protein
VIPDDSVEATDVEKDICIDCGTGMDKPRPVQINAFMVAQPLSLCPRCDEAWRWRKQICVPLCPYHKPLWRPTVSCR